MFAKRYLTKSNPNLERSNNYRKKYFANNRGLFNIGLYFCPYCGKSMFSKKKIQIDHIHSVYQVKNVKRLRRRFSRRRDGVNHINNLVAACKRCNQKKAEKGGLWVFRGMYGIYFMPLFRFLIWGLLGYLLFTYATPFIMPFIEPIIQPIFQSFF